MDTSHSLKSGARMRVSKTRSTYGSVREGGSLMASVYNVAPPIINSRFRFGVCACDSSKADFRLCARTAEADAVSLASPRLVHVQQEGWGHKQIIVGFCADHDVLSAGKWSELLWDAFPCIPSHYHRILATFRGICRDLSEILELLGEFPRETAIDANTVCLGGCNNDGKRHDVHGSQAHAPVHI